MSCIRAACTPPLRLTSFPVIPWMDGIMVPQQGVAFQASVCLLDACVFTEAIEKNGISMPLKNHPTFSLCNSNRADSFKTGLPILVAVDAVKMSPQAKRPAIKEGPTCSTTDHVRARGILLVLRKGGGSYAQPQHRRNRHGL